MKISLVLLTVVSCMSVLSAMRIRRAVDNDDGLLNLERTVNTNKTKTCTTKDGKLGQCFPEYMCSEDHTFQEGGIIEGSEIRSNGKEECDRLEWCCTVEDLKTKRSQNQQK